MGHVLRDYWNRKICAPVEEATFYRGNLRLRGSSDEPPEPQGWLPQVRPTHPGESASWVYPPFGERAHAKAVTESSRPINVPAFPAAREAAFRLI